MELSHESLQINKLVEEVESLRKINQILEKKDGISEDKVLEIEMELRQELSEEYEKRIQELDMIHAKALNSLKESNIKSNDDRLKALSEDYEQRVKEIKEELEQNIEHLNEQNKVLTKENEKLSNESQKHHKAANKVTKLQEEIEFLKKSNLETEQILISDITEVRRQNEELEKKLEAVQSELISLEKKDKKRTKKMTELNSQLDEAQKKRKSDADDEFSTFKRNKIIAEVDDYDSNFDQEESELTSFSPIVLSQSQLMSSSPEKRQFKVPMAVSPSKTFNTVEKPVFPNSVSPKKTKSPSSKGLNSGKTPLRKVLKEVNFDLSTATRLKKSPLKSPLKSPSKKKKVRPGFMIEADDSF
jgi:chromosome segregation ATPase